jgi:hypothetical protein
MRAMSTRLIAATTASMMLTATPALAHGSHHAFEPTPSHEAGLDDAEAVPGDGDVVEALASYTLEYEALSPTDRAGELGESIIDRALALAPRQVVDPSEVIAAGEIIRLLERHLEEIARVDPDRDIARYHEELDRLDLLLPTEPPPLPAPDPVPTPVAEPSVLPSPAIEKPPRQRRGLGLGLLIGGAAAFAGGGVVLGLGANRFVGTTQEFRARRNTVSSDCTVPGGGICSLNDWKNEEYRAARITMAIGGTLAAVGLALGIGGSVVLAKGRDARKRTARRVPYTVSAPFVFAGGAGLTTRGRF